MGGDPVCDVVLCFESESVSDDDDSDDLESATRTAFRCLEGVVTEMVKDCAMVKLGVQRIIVSQPAVSMA